MLSVVLGFSVLFISTNSSAEESGFRLKLSYGFATIKELKETEIEDRIFAQENVTGTYSSNPKSNPFEAGVGYAFNRHFALYILKNERLTARVKTNIGYDGDIGGENLRIKLVDIERYARLDGWSINAVGKMKLLGPLEGTVTLGALYGDAFIALRSSKIPYEIEAISRFQGWVPIVGAGLMYTIPKTKLSLTLGKTYYGKFVDITALGGEYAW